MNIQLRILHGLRLVHPRMQPLETLWQETQMALVPKPTRSDFNQAIRELEDAGEIIQQKDKDRTRVKITGDGIARHEEANQ